MLLDSNKYLNIVSDIKKEIFSAQHRAMISANKELILLYWKIGNIINANTEWGNKFIENLSRDIHLDFPNTKGYSVRNLKYMAKFADTYKDIQIVQQLVAQLPWGHNIALMDKIKDSAERMWYIDKCIENAWSRNNFVHQIEFNLYARQEIVKKTTNYKSKLISPQSELAEQTLKDPYIFDFIELKENMLERDIENELVRNVTKLLLELGTGFAFLGNQYHIEVGGDDFYIDLLFYHITLRCYIVVELKTGEFKPEYAGKINFYLSAVDSILKKEQDNPSIGILLCKKKNNVVVEYALKDMSKPIGVSEYKLTDYLPKEFENTLPSIKDIENRIKESVETTTLEE